MTPVGQSSTLQVIGSRSDKGQSPAHRSSLNNSGDSHGLVSVVLPLYNVSEYVGDAIESISLQTYKDIEVVLVDDGSEDGSLDVAMEAICSCGLKNYRAIQQENAGVSAARNRGAEAALGDWLIFLDPDDVLAPKTIESLVRGSVSRGVTVAISNFTLIDNTAIPYDCPFEKPLTFLSKEEALKSHLLRNRNMAAPAILVSSDLAAEVPFSEGCRYGEDVMWVWELLANSNGVGYLEAPGYGYRLRPGSTITAPSLDRIRSGAISFLKLDDLLKGVLGNSTWAASRWMLGVMHVLARYGTSEQSEWFYRQFYRERIPSLYTFPQVRVRILALLSMLGPRLLRALMKR